MPGNVQRYVSNNGVRIYRIGCQATPGLAVRVYLLLEAGVPTLVDAGSGMGECTAQILAGFARVRDEFGEAIEPADIRRIIITHAHIDHFGGVTSLLEHMPAEVAIHPLDGGAVAAWEEHAVICKRRLEGFFEEAGVEQPLRGELLVASRFDRQRLQPAPIGLWLADGQKFDGLTILHTPGHSSGHVCIAVGNVLLTADHILAQTLPQQWPERMSPYLGLAHYLDSLDRIDRLPGFSIGLASHEADIDDVYHRIEVIRHSHQRRLDRITTFLREGARPMSIAELAQKMYGELAGFRGMLALTDVGARIEYLHQLGRVALANLDEVEGDPRATWRFELRS
jgi:glyoxylase-like metal-dependent hydrolase (beta-lactamase superfamily II)